MTEEQAWKLYNFVNDWKNGEYGETPLSEALDEPTKRLPLEDAFAEMSYDTEKDKITIGAQKIRVTAATIWETAMLLSHRGNSQTNLTIKSSCCQPPTDEFVGVVRA